jgi:hypothetical protein
VLPTAVAPAPLEDAEQTGDRGGGRGRSRCLRRRAGSAGCWRSCLRSATGVGDKSALPVWRTPPGASRATRSRSRCRPGESAVGRA